MFTLFNKINSVVLSTMQTYCIDISFESNNLRYKLIQATKNWSYFRVSVVSVPKAGLELRASCQPI